jgi:WD40 repeat protein
LASSSRDGVIAVWDTNTGEKKGEWKHTSAVLCLCWKCPGAELLAGGRDGSLMLWDTIANQNARQVQGHQGPVRRVCWIGESSTIVSAGQDGALRIWDDSWNAATLHQHQTAIHALAWNPKFRRLAYGAQNHVVHLLDLDTRDHRGIRSGHLELITAVDFSPNGKRLLSADARGTIKLWDVATGEATLTLQGPIGRLTTARWSPDGRRVAAAIDDGFVIWDATTGYRQESPQGESDLSDQRRLP